jgi:hypothetical protein
VGGEIQLTDAIARLMAHEAVYAYQYSGKRYDCGSKRVFLKRPWNWRYSTRGGSVVSAVPAATVSVIGVHGMSDVAEEQVVLAFAKAWEPSGAGWFSGIACTGSTVHVAMGIRRTGWCGRYFRLSAAQDAHSTRSWRQ